MTREAWLNGWRRLGNIVVVGTQVCCAGCGADHGTTCVGSDYMAGDKREPEWPFGAENCPLCAAYESLAKQPADLLTERLIAMRERREKGK